MGFRTFITKAPSTKFVVQNIAPEGKRIRIFNCPIRNRATKDLLAIPEVSEDVIRHSLLKGDLRVKALCGEIVVVQSDIDLLQFNDEHKAFLQSIGITIGLEITSGISEIPFTFKQGVSLIGTQDGSNRIFTTPDNFINGTLGNNEFRIKITHNGRDLVENQDYTLLESGGAGTGFNTIIFVSFMPAVKSLLEACYVIPS